MGRLRSSTARAKNEAYCDQRTPVERSDKEWMKSLAEQTGWQKLCLRELEVVNGLWHCPKHGFKW